MKNEATQSGRGRPMDPQVHKAILSAAIKLLETQCVGELTIKGIADAAGVTRPAIYRRWSTPTEIALDAFLETAEREIPFQDGSDPIKALTAHILAMTRFMRSQRGRVVTELLGAAQSDPELLALFRERFLEQRRKLGRVLFQNGIDQGAFHTGLDIDLAIDLYAGPIYHRALAGHETLTDAFAERLADYVLHAIGASS
ncbi:TetR/AcrR family transcriptional regulator [uncultured Roseobacter sp.]|uniref:TetR/AcrR family transcriptional regulator n=1 Tax=uncultured Roseobacter sp. TaxID=114847 RepID=UPI002639355A|nr:TetR/AcrR family transcriptional regulator [uncultured Roseobacter sp.]